MTVPFASSYKAAWMAMGVIGGWMMVLLGLSYYARTRIGMQRWKMLHRFTLLAWVLGLAHSLGEGTDAGRLWFLASVGLVVLPALSLVVLRVSGTLSPRPSATIPAR